MKKLIGILFTFLLTMATMAQSGNTGDVSLEETYWKLTKVAGKPIYTTDGTKEVHLQLKKDHQQIQGFAGCNRLMGSYQTDANQQITITAGSTRMMCQPATMQVESAFLKALGNCTRFEIKDNQLFLYKKKKLVAVLEAVYF